MDDLAMAWWYPPTFVVSPLHLEHGKVHLCILGELSPSHNMPTFGYNFWPYFYHALLVTTPSPIFFFTRAFRAINFIHPPHSISIVCLNKQCFLQCSIFSHNTNTCNLPMHKKPKQKCYHANLNLFTFIITCNILNSILPCPKTKNSLYCIRYLPSYWCLQTWFFLYLHLFGLGAIKEVHWTWMVPICHILVYMIETSLDM